MKNILLPTDFSDNSHNAIQYAMELFRGTQTCFHFLNVHKAGEFVLDNLMTAAPGSSLHQAVLKDSKKQLQEFVAHFKEVYRSENFEFKLFVDYDTLTHSVEQMIRHEAIDLIVMGTNGATGAGEVLFGSNTLHIIRNIDSPLLVIPQNYNYKPIGSVVFTARKCKDVRDERAEPLIELLRSTGAELHILKIKGNETSKQTHNCGACLVDALAGLNHTSHTLTGVPEHFAVSAFIQLNNPGLHAMFVERESFLDRFFHGNCTAKISLGTHIPLLVLHK
ncbi:MAG: universal stress protein [Bacteroidota bacterium]